MPKNIHGPIKERLCRHCGEPVGWMSPETWRRHSQLCVRCLQAEQTMNLDDHIYESVGDGHEIRA